MTIFCGENECTRSNREKKFFPTQHDDVLSAAIKKCIPVWKMQGRSHGARQPSRIREVRSAMAAPPSVRARLISRAILHTKCLRVRELISPQLEFTSTKFAQYSTTGADSLFDVGIHFSNNSTGERDAGADESAYADPTNNNDESSLLSETVGGKMATGLSGGSTAGSDEPKTTKCRTVPTGEPRHNNSNDDDRDDEDTQHGPATKVEDGTPSQQVHADPQREHFKNEQQPFWNILSISVKLETSHLEISLLNNVAP